MSQDPDPLGGKQGPVGQTPTYEELLVRVAQLEQQHQRQQQQLLEREWLLALVNSLPDDVFVVDTDNRLVFANDAVRESLGVSDKDDVLGLVNEIQAKFQVLKPDATPRKPEEAPSIPALRGENVRGEEIVRNVKTGELRNRQYQFTPVCLGGKIVGAVSLVRDVTQRKRAEEALRESEGRLAAFFENAPATVWLKDLDGRFLKVNRHMVEALGKPEDEFIGHTVAELYPGGPGDEYVANDEHVIAVGTAMEFEETAALTDGPHVFRSFKFPLRDAQGRICGVGAICHDVTERKRGEQALRQSEARMRAVIGALSEAVVFLNPQGEVVEISDAVQRLHGHTLDELQDAELDPRRRIVRGDGTPFPVEQQPAMVALGSGEAVRDVEMGVPLRDGSIRWRLVNAQPVRDDLGQLLGAVASFFDITERKRTEEALRRKQAELQVLFDHTPAGLVLFDAKPPYQVLAHNRYYQELFAEPCRSRGMVGLNVYDYAPAVEASGVVAVFDEVVRTKEPKVFLDFPYQSKPPKPSWFNWHMLPLIMDDRVVALVSMSIEVTERHLAEAALRQSEERFRFALQDSPVTVGNLDRDLRYTWIHNTRHGFTPEMVIGKRPDELIPPEDVAELMAFLTHVLESGERDRREVSGRTEGMAWHYDTIAEPLRDNFGQMVGIALAQIDIAERKKAVEELAKQRQELEVKNQELQALFDHTNVSLALFNAEPPYTVLAHNKYYLSLWDERFQRGGLVGKTLLDYVPDVRESGVMAVYDEVVATKCTKSLLSFPYDGMSRGRTWWNWHLAPVVHDGEIIALAHMGVDVTNEVTALHAAEAMSASLKAGEQQQRELAKQLMEADRQKNHFLAVLSHELRNPLTPIRNSLFILDRAVPGGEQASRAKAVIDRQVSHLARLVDDLLDVTRIISGKLRLERDRFDLVEVLGRTADDHRSTFAKAEVVFDAILCPGPVWMHGDETRVAQAAGNLLANAVKFTERGGRVGLVLEMETPTQTAIIRVWDTGLGIAQDLLSTLFEPFVQADKSLDRSRGGLGLGLALVKSVVELHGGSITARSEGRGAGAEFIVRLPIEVQAVLPLGEGKRPSSRPPPRRILSLHARQRGTTRDPAGKGRRLGSQGPRRGSGPHR